MAKKNKKPPKTFLHFEIGEALHQRLEALKRQGYSKAGHCRAILEHELLVPSKRTTTFIR